ncbi:MAG TPA: transglutaminase-like domain-containing protein [Roseiflexaceae bacterium]|jgi:regulator of sirC expression with transglutaminase-like and TPR domain|nr:transglutaminase-like domain-containing protein [Roseiflexaceae bacterium]
MLRHLPARRRFQSLVRQPEAALDLAQAALCIAWEDQNTDNLEVTLQHIAALVHDLRPRIDAGVTPHDHVAAINAYLFEECGFHGNTADYNDPANSFLDQVIARRTGLPITLSVLYMEVGRRLGLPISGVALPGHFLARYATPIGAIYIDPFHGGKLWSADACAQQIIDAYGAASPALIRQIMQPPTKRAILARMLRNLKHTYVHMSDYQRALGAVERILLLEPHTPQEVRDRGLLRLHLDDLHRALDDIDQYVQAMPDASDVMVLREQMRPIATFLASVN